MILVLDRHMTVASWSGDSGVGSFQDLDRDMVVTSWTASPGAGVFQVLDQYIVVAMELVWSFSWTVVWL